MNGFKNKFKNRNPTKVIEIPHSKSGSRGHIIFNEFILDAISRAFEHCLIDRWPRVQNITRLSLQGNNELRQGWKNALDKVSQTSRSYGVPPLRQADLWTDRPHERILSYSGQVVWWRKRVHGIWGQRLATFFAPNTCSQIIWRS